MEHKHSPNEIRQRQAGPDAAFFEEMNTLRDRIARLAESASDRGTELDLHGMLLDVLPSPVWVAAADGKCVFFNRSWLKYTGRTMEQELGDGWAEGIHPDDMGRVMATYYDYLANRGGFHLEYRLRRHDGKFREVVDLGQPFFERNGDLAGYIGSVFDFTERVDAERQMNKIAHDLGERIKELTALNRILGLYQNPGPVPVLLSQAVMMLPPAYQHPEVTAARIIYGEHIVSTPNYRETPWKQVATFRADDELDCAIEVVYLEERPPEGEGPFLKEERTLINSLALLTRAFINRRLADDLRARLASIVESSDDAIIGKTLDGIITSWNPAAERIYGYAAKEAIGRSISIIVPQERMPEIHGILRKISKGERTDHLETIRRTKDGRLLDVSIAVSPILDPNRRIVGASTIARDISERQRMVKDLEDARAQAELYLDLISHDINNLNQAGMGYLELALETLPLNNEQRLLLEKPMDAMKSSSDLIRNVRKLQQLKSGELQSKPVNLCGILADLVARYEHIPGANLIIQSPPVEKCMVMANDLIWEVFSNLIENAIKHGASPGRPLEIGIGLSGMREAGKDYYVVVVEDNGPGIPDTIKYRLFRRFERGETRADGKGLGLYIVRMLMQNYGGRVWAEDRVPGDYKKGSRFVVVLPAAD